MSRQRARLEGRHRWPLLVALGAVLAGCGQGDPPQAVPVAGDAQTTDAVTGTADPSPDDTAAACLVASADAVAAATGLTVVGHEEWFGGCRWRIEPVEDEVADAAISWQPLSLPDFEDPRQTDPSGTAITEVPDLGDDAYVMSEETGHHPVGLVFVRVGDQAFRVANEFTTGRTPGSIDTQQALAALIAESLR